ncbi:hypothetical protein ACIJYD_01260 [Candidatus Pelagibacter bacterium nBUS_33]|uniref:hypothetical protein n=1 Tax=Candidatus Pelagibacter bacterium nBUS_33 TaxID=3374193 RepID=UPI003EBEA056
MKKLSSYLLLIFLSFLTFSFADDISEYEIEGISIGDSLLDYMSREEIESNLVFVYEDLDKNIGKDVAQIPYSKNLNLYDVVYIDFKTNDNIFEIIAMSGTLFYKDNIKECYEKQLQLVEDLKLVFKDADLEKEGPINHPAYPGGEVKYTRYAFFINQNNRSNLEIFCYDIDEVVKKTDRLTVSFKSKEFNNFANKVYK